MNHLIILAGIPGCGKSTWAADILCDHTIVSSAAIHEELNDVNDQTRNNEVFDTFHERIAIALGYGKNVVADSTALDFRARSRLCEIAKSAGPVSHPVHLVYFSNCGEAVQRNHRRERRVPDDVMIRMLDKYEYFKTSLLQEVGCYNSITEIRST